MNFKVIDGKNYVLMEPNEELRVAFFRPGDDELSIKSVTNRLNIEVSDNLLGTFKKRYIPFSHVSKDEIIMFCDNWFELYKKTYEKFKEYALNNYNSPKGKMYIDLSTWYTYKNRSCKCIYLNLSGNAFNEKVRGAKLIIELKNSALFRYLFARIFDHYIKENYKDTYIKNAGYTLGSIYKDGVDRVAEAEFISIRDIESEENIIDELIKNHNDENESKTEELIYNLRNSIESQELDMDSLMGFYNESKDNYLKIASEVDKQVRARRLK